MGEIDTFMHRAPATCGEIDQDDPWGPDTRVPADIWPGRRSDMESLERNARYFRDEERRQFFRRMAASVRTWLADQGGRLAFERRPDSFGHGQCLK